MMASSGEKWYALCVAVNREHMVSAHLREVGLAEYLPLQRGKLTKPQPPRALFPGYVFCRLDLCLGPKLYKIPGVVRILGYGNTPVPIDEQEIDALRNLVGSAVLFEPWPYIRPDAIVRIVAGPFAGRSGTVIRSGNTRKLVISLELLQRSLAITMPADWVVVIGDADVGKNTIN